MKKTAKILSVLLNIFAVCFCLSQTEAEIYNSLENQNSTHKAYIALTQEYQQNNQIRNTNIYVEQIGVNNYVNTSQISNISNIQFYQYGYGNSILNNVNSPIVNQYFFQYGNQNSIVNNLYSASIINNSIIQIGDNLNLMNYGNNSISNNLRIYMTGYDKTVIIKNFK